MVECYAIAALAVLLTATAQLLLKIGVSRARHGSTIAIYLHPYSVIAYALLLLATLLNVYAFRVLPLKVAAEILPFTYILVGIYARLLLKERMSGAQWLGAALIVAGVVLFAI